VRPSCAIIASVFDDPLTGTIASFLIDIGLEVVVAELRGDTFLPGIRLREGRVEVDPTRLRFPGDLLHEAGHLAVLAPEQRRAFGDDEDAEDTVPEPDMRRLEIQAMAWSYAAALHLRLDPAVVFHDSGYRGNARGLLQTFSLGVYLGVADLQEAGLTAMPRDAERLRMAPYPQMSRWLRA
jgi:hypothetical protein